jgi:hypothetical protein
MKVLGIEIPPAEELMPGPIAGATPPPPAPAGGNGAAATLEPERAPG